MTTVYSAQKVDELLAQIVGIEADQWVTRALFNALETRVAALETGSSILPGTLDSATEAYFGRLSSEYTDQKKLALDFFVKSAKLLGLWSKLDGLYLPFFTNNYDESKQNVIQNKFNLVAKRAEPLYTGTAWYGFNAGDGTCFLTGIVMNDSANGVKLSDHDLTIAAWCLKLFEPTRIGYAINVDMHYQDARVGPFNEYNAIRWDSPQNGYSQLAPISDADRYMVALALDSTNQTLYVGDFQKSQVTREYTVPYFYQFGIGGYLQGGGGLQDTYENAIMAAFIGKSLTEGEVKILRNLIAILGAQLGVTL
jgi:hypothetical protein